MRPNPQPELHAGFRTDIKASIEAMPASRLIGLAVLGFNSSGVAAIEMAITSQLAFDGKVVQGGIVGMLADYAGVSSVICTLEPGWMASTTRFEVHNLAPAKGERLIAIGHALSIGKSHRLARVEVYAEQGGKFDLVCAAMVTCRPFSLR